MIVLAVASGTSADGLDVGLVDLGWAEGGRFEAEVLDTWTQDWPAGLAERLLALLPPAATTAAEVCALDTAVGQAVGRVAAAAVDRCRDLVGTTPELVVSPGQTVHHEVQDGVCRGTLQLGQPAWVAEATGLPVVSDLRARDVAAGGHGAPLAGVLDQLWLGGLGGPQAALNLGGIANLTLVRPGAPALAWDTGPAGCLLDVAAERATRGRLRYDRDGALAVQGTVHPALLSALLAHPHFRAVPPASTGRETFSAGFLDTALTLSGVTPGEGPGKLPWPDLLATLTELTAVTVVEALARVAGPDVPAAVVASGGGTANPVLMAALDRRLRERLGGVALRTSDELGLPTGGKEAVLWALLGFLTWHGVPALDPAGPATGARAARILGRLTPGAEPLRLPEPVDRRPQGLRVRSREVT